MAPQHLIGAIILASAAPIVVGETVEISSRGEVIPLVSPVRASSAGHIFEPEVIERLVRISAEESLANIGAPECVYVGILSARDHSEHRHRVRKAFLNDLRKENQDGEGRLGNNDVAVVAEFIIGHADPAPNQFGHVQGRMASDSLLVEEVDLTNEAARFGDIRRVHILDDYKFLTDKVMQILGIGVMRQCRLVVKLDDDQVLNLTEAKRFAGSLAPDALYYGGINLWTKPSYEKQRGVDHLFEPYFAGPAYALSNALATKIVDSRMYVGEVQLYGSTSEDADMGRWVHHQVALGANVTFATIPLSTALA